MGTPQPVADEALVVRCGVPPFVKNSLDRACGRHPDGPFGFSVQAAVGLKVEDLAAACFNRSVGFTTVAEIRIMGYQVLRTSGEAHHATVVVPENWSAEAAAALAQIFQHAINPAPKKRNQP
jgi:hypothetical protein